MEIHWAFSFFYLKGVTMINEIDTKEIKLENSYSLIFVDTEKWDIVRNDGSKVNKNNLPGYVYALVRYIIRNYR